MAEATIVDAIRTKVLKPLEPDLWFMKVHGGPYQKAGVPDFLGCYHGVMFYIEVKQPGKVPTPLQEIEMRRLRRAGAIGGVATSVDEARAIMARVQGKAAQHFLSTLEEAGA